MTVAYDYALVRVVPRVVTGDAEAVGVVLQARQARFLDVRFVTTAEAVAARWPGVDAGVLDRYLAAFAAVAAGGAAAAPLGLLPPSERFHWLTATRSTTLQTSPVRTGRTGDPEAALDAIARGLRRP
ncbi:DUF3037 domain-containing protein [Rubrivirga litoralis]|uniref:DUF3037 domain-containing protein n=1 Tax=Rubrivirga litoralis TaxID=3075598 RepID=A0ABU3BMR5_9BACT|nr:DUF3037 domain-containing protein [Rubrivirga sp. F394]MDT0630531.1 DUF3037 domain-containing protein [Rubrivirga sp. F394]